MVSRIKLYMATAFVLPFGLGAQSLTYALQVSAAPQPSPRLDGAISYDSAGQQVYLFGGQDSVARNDLWSYSLTQKRWTEVAASGTPPPARFGHTVVFDSVRRRLIVFAGQGGVFFSDVWAFDIAAGSWKQLSADNAGPSRRYGHSGIYETARDRMVISHGFTNAGRFDDTWAFDFATNSWRDISPSGTRPLRRCLHHAAYDAERGQMYLYGGCSSGFGPCPQGDLWSFDLALNRWTELTPKVSPPARQHYGTAFDAARGKLVIFGGFNNGLLNDTWDFDPRSGGWQQTLLTGESPSPRGRQEAVYARDRNAVFFFGGSDGTALTNELWMLAPVAGGRPAISAGGVVNAFSGLGGAVAPGEVVSIYGSGLGPAQGAALGFDSQTGQLPVSASGVSVSWNGIAAPLFFVRADQLNVQVPYEIGLAAEAKLSVTVNGLSSDMTVMAVKATHTGLFPQVWNQDGTINSAENPAGAGSIIVLYGTGQGATVPASRTGTFPVGAYPEPASVVVLRIGGLESQILFRGQAPGTAGLIQVNARVPQGVPNGVGIPVVLAVGAEQSQAGVPVWIR